MQTPVMAKGFPQDASGSKTGTGLNREHPLDFSRIAQDLQIRKVQVESVVQLLDEGNTVPFITRYRKERTGGTHGSQQNGSRAKRLAAGDIEAGSCVSGDAGSEGLRHG